MHSIALSTIPRGSSPYVSNIYSDSDPGTTAVVHPDAHLFLLVIFSLSGDKADEDAVAQPAPVS